MDHEVLVDLLRSRPELVPRLLGDRALSAEQLRVLDADLSQMAPPEFHADLIVELVEGPRRRQVVVVEVQTGRDPNKRWSWPAYGVIARSRWRCPAVVLVLTLDARVARWARAPVDLGGGNRWRPTVIGPAEVPRVTDPQAAQACPEEAILSLLAHRHVMQAPQVHVEAMAALTEVDRDRAAVYNDLVLRALGAEARRVLEVLMGLENYVFQSEFALRHIAQGREEGMEEGRQALIRTLEIQLQLRFGAPPADLEARVADAPLATLERWLRRVLTADSVEAVFADD